MWVGLTPVLGCRRGWLGADWVAMCLGRKRLASLGSGQWTQAKGRHSNCFVNARHWTCMMSSAVFACPFYLSTIRFFVISREISILLAHELFLCAFLYLVCLWPLRIAATAVRWIVCGARDHSSLFVMTTYPGLLTISWHHRNASCLLLMRNPTTCHYTSCIGCAEIWNIFLRFLYQSHILPIPMLSWK